MDAVEKEQRVRELIHHVLSKCDTENVEVPMITIIGYCERHPDFLQTIGIPKERIFIALLRGYLTAKNIRRCFPDIEIFFPEYAEYCNRIQKLFSDTALKAQFEPDYQI